MDPDLLRRLDRARNRLAVEPLPLVDAAHEACLSPFHFHRQFVRAFGQTPHAFATERRLEEAKRLLLATELSVGEIVLSLGYESHGSFATRFAREFGSAPTVFRRDARRFWSLGGIRTYRFVPTCYFRNRKIGEGFPSVKALS